MGCVDMNYRGVPHQVRNPYYMRMPNGYQNVETQQPPQPNVPQYGYYETPFEQYAKPPQPNNWYVSRHPYDQSGGQGSTNDKPATFVKPFQTETGQFDFNKMLSTVGQLADTVQQVSPFIKQVGSMIKTFR